MERTVRVDHKGGDLFEIAIRQHVLHVDQPTEDGGSDAAPTPTEMFGQPRLLRGLLQSAIPFPPRSSN
jgi:hypothetical protein